MNVKFALVFAIAVIGATADISPTTDPLKPREYSALIFRRPPRAVTATGAEEPKNTLECADVYLCLSESTRPSSYGYNKQVFGEIIQEIR